MTSAMRLVHPPSPSIRLGLGTAQFGLDYGISNTQGKVPLQEARAIIDEAFACGIDILDTATAYGDAEEVVGKCLGECQDGVASETVQVNIVSKTPVNLRRLSTGALPTSLQDACAISLQKLNIPQLHGYLVHHADDLLSDKGQAIWDAMRQLHASGMVRKIGFSAYTSEEILSLLEWCTPDIVQIPMNAVDHRLITSGALQALKSRKVEVHVRSIFLQGILLQPVERLQGFFAPLKSPIARLDAACKEAGISRMAGLLAAVWHQGHADCLIVGVTRQHELQQLLQAASEAAQAGHLHLPHDMAIADERVLNPSLWPTKH